jgi:hypothetical protein
MTFYWNWEIRLLIIIIPSLVFTFLIFNPNEKEMVIQTYTKLVPTGAEYKYIFPNNTAIISHDTDGGFRITQNDLKPPSLPLSIVTGLFSGNSNFGWQEICFHNIRSVFHLYNYATNLDQKTVFNFNDQIIRVSNGSKTCEPLPSNEKFFVIINNRA